MNVFFDLDGVIIDSNDLIVHCYKIAGVKAPPDVLAREGTPWLANLVGEHEDAIRLKKDLLYARAVANGQAQSLSGATVARELAACGYRVHLLTGAPSSVLDALRNRFDPWPFTAAVGKLSQPKKFDLIRCFKGERVYIDDQPIRERQSGVRVIKYTRQPAKALMEDVCRRISAWAPFRDE